MGEKWGTHCGGIIGLLGEIEKHGQALEYDLIRMGLRLRRVGSKEFTWRDLWIIVQQLPADAHFNMSRAGHPPLTVGMSVLDATVAILNTLRLANWQRAGDNTRPRPETARLPWWPQPRGQQSKLGSDPVQANRFSDWWEGK